MSKKSLVLCAQITMVSLCFLCVTTSSVQAAEKPSGDWQEIVSKVDADSAVSGTWKKGSGKLTVDAKQAALIMLPVQPTGEYDFRVTFTRKTGTHSVGLVFIMNGKQATFDIDAWGKHLAGFQNIDGKDMQKNGTSSQNHSLTNGKEFIAEVQVRKNGATAYIDNKLVATYKGDGSNFSLHNIWGKADGKSLGLTAYANNTEFTSIQVRSVKGSSIASSGTTKTPATKTENRNSISDDISKLSDEFDNSNTLRNWMRVYQTEKSNADQLEKFDISKSKRGWMTMMPYTSTWYKEYRGVLAYKEVEGDFVVTTQVNANRRGGNGAPRSRYSLAGLMIRTPRNITPRTWRPRGENYIFLSIGAAAQPSRFSFEVKTTINSDSQLVVTPTSSGNVDIRIARIGKQFVLLRRTSGGKWTVHKRYHRRDMPDNLQVGFTVYTDYSTASKLSSQQHAVTVIKQGKPDLVAQFNYIRYKRPKVPTQLQGKNITNESQVSNTQLLSFLGESAD